jgi:membrane-associated protein
MEILSDLISMFLHMDEVLAEVIRQYGTLTYAFLFLVIFLETGLVVTPFLPGDSLLFAAGALSVTTDLDPLVLFALLAPAAILGDAANYTIGHKVGARAFDGSIKFLKKEYLDKTHAFYEKHGNKTIVLARFVPIVRTFAPFVAGVGKMTYLHFATYNVIGGVVWVALFIAAGYFFGEIPFVKENFEFVVIGIILVSVLPGVFEWWKARQEAKAAKPD